MADNYKEYLAANILSEGRIVTYRSLSRAIKVHVNTAKEMLYEFHRQQNVKKPSSIHATYLLGGTRHPTESRVTNGNHATDGEDEIMQSSPLMGSSMPDQEVEKERILFKTVTLVLEEDLERVKGLYEKVDSMHVYSVQPQTLKSLQILSDSNREISAKYASEDPLLVGKSYGTILNPNVKRRAGRRPQPPAQAKVAPIRSVKPDIREKREASEIEQTQSERRESAGTKVPQNGARRDVTGPAQPVKKPQNKREGSDLFKSFAKSKSKPKGEVTVSPAAASEETSAAEDDPMKDASEDEQEEDLALLNAGNDRRIGRNTRSEREEQLRKMMDEKDEPMVDQASSPAEDSQEIDNPIAVPQMVESEDLEQPTASTSGARKRGRRKVMKKKTVRDDEGYLVTRESPSWESFSESETEQPKPVRAPASTAPASLGKAKKDAGKPGQGNIMSFFGKK